MILVRLSFLAVLLSPLPLFAAVQGASQPAPQWPEPDAYYMARVKEVHDGDTMIVTLEDPSKTIYGLSGPDISIRLGGVDTPEYSPGYFPVPGGIEMIQPYGYEAMRFTAQFVGRRVIFYPTAPSYNRVVAHVHLADTGPVGTYDIALALVTQGLGWWYSKYTPDFVHYGVAQQTARAPGHRLGLWAQETPEAPWDFRARVRNSGPAPVVPPAATQAADPAACQLSAQTYESMYCGYDPETGTTTAVDENWVPYDFDALYR